MKTEQTARDNTAADLQKEYDNVKGLIRKKKRRRLMKILLSLLGAILILYSASYVWKRLTLYPITKSELTGKEDGTQFAYNRMIENELHEPQTRLLQADISKYEYPLSLPSGEYEISWMRTSSLGFQKAYYDAGYYQLSETLKQGHFKKNTLGGGGALYEEGTNAGYRYDAYKQQLMMSNLQKEWKKSKLDEIADHSLVGAYVKLKKAYPLQSILDLDTRMKKEGIDIGLSWVAVAYGKAGESDSHIDAKGNITETDHYLGTVGFDIHQKNRTNPLTDFDEKKYPLLDFDAEPVKGHPKKEFGKISAQDYETHMISMLQYLYDQPKYRTYLGDDGDTRSAFYPDIISSIQKNGIQSDMMYVTATKEAFQKLMEQPETASAFIAEQK